MQIAKLPLAIIYELVERANSQAVDSKLRKAVQSVYQIYYSGLRYTKRREGKLEEKRKGWTFRTVTKGGEET